MEDIEKPTAPDVAETLRHAVEENPILPLLETWDYIRSLDIKIEWIVDRIIPKESITIIYGKGGVGKTWLALDMCRHIGSGMPFAGHVTLKTPVVYIDFENPVCVLSARLRAIGGGEGVHFWRANRDEVKPPKLDSDGWGIYKRLPRGSLLIFDTLRASHAGNENQSDTMGLIMGRLKELRDMGFTVVLLHHSPKNNDTSVKGSSAIIDLADHTLCLTKEGDNESSKMLGAIYNFGVIGKSRYEPYQVCLTFDPEKGFELATDKGDASRQDDALGKMFRLLLECGELNKTDFLSRCGEAKIGSRQELTDLFGAGTGKYWTVEKGAHNRHLVKAIQFHSFEDSHRPGKLENHEEAAAGTDSCPEIPAAIAVNEVPKPTARRPFRNRIIRPDVANAAKPEEIGLTEVN